MGILARNGLNICSAKVKTAPHLKYIIKLADLRFQTHLQANIYLFKVNNRNTRKMCKICSKLVIKTPERRQ